MRLIQNHKGREATYQSRFPYDMKCKYCEYEHSIYLFTAYEDIFEDKFVCDMVDRSSKSFIEEKLMWPHDAMAIAVYLCPKCAKITADWNQA